MRDDSASIERGADALDRAKGLSDEVKPVSLFDDEGRKKSQATLLLELCDGIQFFHDADLLGYAAITESEHTEVWPVQSRVFRNWLGHQYYKLTQQGARGPALNDALATIEAKALHASPRREVFMRVAWLKDRIYIDLANDKWSVVEIAASGWRVLDQSPVMFVRRTGMAALPIPVQGDLADLVDFVNVSPKDMPLIIGWLLMAARGRGPYPVLVVHGEQGTGKSTLTRVLRNLIDPSTVPLRGLNRDVRDLIVTATNNHVLVLDNLSGLTPECSDALCRFATGGGFAERQLYTNREEVLINVQRPVILNGIEDIATRGDLLERSIILQLPVIVDSKRCDEQALDKQFDEKQPGLLGGLINALSTALRELPKMQLTNKPRMADFALWVTASESALGWKKGEFLKCYRDNQDAGTEVALEASPFGEALFKFMGKTQLWKGTASELLNLLDQNVHERILKSQSWPKSGKGSSNALRRLSPLLRRLGVHVSFGLRAGEDGRRIVEIKNVEKQPSVPSVSSVIDISQALSTDGTPSVLTEQKSIVSASSVVSVCK